MQHVFVFRRISTAKTRKFWTPAPVSGSSCRGLACRAPATHSAGLFAQAGLFYPVSVTHCLDAGSELTEETKAKQQVPRPVSGRGTCSLCPPDLAQRGD